MQTGPLPERKFMLSIDVEEWYQTENLRQLWPPDSWDKAESRVEGNVRRLLDLLDETKTKATFFTLGCIAEKHPAMVREMFNRGHEIASHGFRHVLTNLLTPEQWQEDVVSTKKLLEDVTASAVIGYRAPSFTIQPYCFEILWKAGYLYDSSFFPSSHHDRYGKVNIPSLAPVTRVDPGIYEIPIPTLNLAGMKLPWGGGAYFRLIPFPVFGWGVTQISRQTGSYLFYLHPWELDPGQPYQGQLKRSFRFRHYTGLKGTEQKLRRLLRAFSFTRIDAVLHQVMRSEGSMSHPVTEQVPVPNKDQGLRENPAPGERIGQSARQGRSS